MKLKIAIVYLHEDGRFEVWLGGSNRKIQAEFLYARWNPVVSPASLTLSIGEKALLTPSASGGLWVYDNQYLALKANKNGTVTITGLKKGFTIITYKLGNGSTDIAVKVVFAALPPTGQNDLPAALWLGLSWVLLAAVLITGAFLRDWVRPG